jgi:SAM-dependent methyltransferase
MVDPERHWYYRSKLVGLQRALSDAGGRSFSRVLDVGAGSGFFSEQLIRNGMCSSRVCVDPNYSDAQLSDADDAKFLREASPATVGACDLALFIDVLEHVDDDVALLRAYGALLPPGASVVVSVPAFQSLWSGHDEFLEHRRRYRLHEVNRVVEDADLVPVTARYLFGTGFIPAWLSHKVFAGGGTKSQLKPLNPTLDRALGAWFSAEHRLLQNRRFGLSAVVVGEVKRRG